MMQAITQAARAGIMDPVKEPTLDLKTADKYQELCNLKIEVKKLHDLWLWHAR